MSEVYLLPFTLVGEQTKALLDLPRVKR